MNATIDLLTRLERLPRLIDTAVERARRGGGSVLVSLTSALDAAGLPTGASLNAASECFRFEQPSRGFCLSATGEAARIDAAGPARFDVVRTELQRLLDAAVIEGADLHPGAPIALAGFAFDPDSSAADDTWRAFADASVVLPRLLVARRRDGATLTANLLVDAATEAASATQALRDELERLFSTPARRGDASNAVTLASGDDRAGWCNAVRSLTERIGRGEAEKVVLARRVSLTSETPFDLDAAVERLRGRYPDCTVFAVRRGDACFLGATPEMLVALDGRRVRTDCLAGSAARGATAAEDGALGDALLADDKEQREHALVTRGLVEALEPLCDSLDVPATPVLRRTANVQHLHTPIEATTDRERHVLELVQRLHPTPATAGLPRARSLCLIREHEPFSRGWYAGPVGWIDARGNGEFAVALRSALVRRDLASLYAGCGIVRGSGPEREYEESRIKLQAMSWALGATR